MRYLAAGILLFLVSLASAGSTDVYFTAADLDSLSAALDAYPGADARIRSGSDRFNTGGDSMYIRYLVERVQRSLAEGTVRPDALADLGSELIASGDKDLGQRCISLAVESAMESDPADAVEISGHDGIQRIHRISYHWFIVVFVAFLGTVIFAVSRQYKVRRLQEYADSAEARMKHIMDESARTNQNLVTLTFLALEQVKDYSIHVSRKLKVGQIKDLIADIESGGFLQRQNEKYLEAFDSAFLASYPDFVTKLNTLFRPDSRITLPAPDRLTPELRIAALMRLGIQDSARLAQALGLSLNTIYTYRNRLRSRASMRESFESDLLRIV